MCTVLSLDPYRALAHLHMDTVQVDDGIDGFDRSYLPRFDLIAERIGR